MHASKPEPKTEVELSGEDAISVLSVHVGLKKGWRRFTWHSGSYRLGETECFPLHDR